MNILLINPGRRNYIVQYFLDLKKKFNIKLFLIDSDENIPAFTLGNTSNFVCPQASKTTAFKNFLRMFVMQKKINLIFPLSHWELKILAKDKIFYQKKKVKVIISNSKVIDICRNKLKTIKILENNSLDYPKIINFKDIKKSLPIIKKRIYGNASKGQKIIFKKKEIPLNHDKNFFYQKFYTFNEYGIDILNDLNGNYYHSCARKKLLLRAGDTDKAAVMNNKKFIDIAKKISRATNHVGILDVDLLFNGKKFYILDLNPRIGGGYPFTHEAGNNYIEQILRWAINDKKKVKLKRNILKKLIFSKGISLHFNRGLL